MKTTPLAAALLIAASLAGTANAAFVTDGGFETVTVPVGGYTTFGAGSTIGGGFTVSSGSVDVVGNSFFNAYQGGQSLDLDGSTSGSIYQAINGLSVGQSYTLSFAYSNNPGIFPASAELSIGNFSTTISHSGSSATAMNYTLFSASFTATSTSTLLMFSSLDGPQSNQGIVLDGIAVAPNIATNIAVPEPSSAILCGLGLAAAGFVGVRRRRASV